MVKKILVTADDFGLTRGITDSILEVVDRGPVRLVSILANGEAVAYALSEYKKRAAQVMLAVHINLTEGPALLPFSAIPHLVDTCGMFKCSIAGLWLAYLFGSRQTRTALRREVRAEMEAQCAVIRTALGTNAFAVNGHQHVHMIPFVFKELMTIQGVNAVRIVREKFFVRGVPSLINVLARFVLVMLSRRATRSARARGIQTNDWFVGVLYSGHMSEDIAQSGIAHAEKGLIEVLFHPGIARNGELQEWRKGRTDVAWHYAPARQREQEALKNFTLANDYNRLLNKN
ncbi:MAG: ChbG/HpnK family deacetylase [Candidatus Kaiserbacteria bacterium]|nr:ChbG/HpnK family deacetylase [Candidatus Kaiserbacteria bacterium]